MKQTTVVSMICAALCLGLTASLAASANVVGVRSLERWQGPGQEVATTLNVVEYSCARQSRRIFVALPDGRWILESTVSPGEGTARSALRHAETGWEIEIEDDYDLSVEIPSPSTFGDVLFWQKLAEAGPFPRERALKVDGVERFTVSRPGHLFVPEDPRETLPVSELTGATRDAPPSVEADLRVLAALMAAPEAASGPMGSFRPLVALLVESLPKEEARPLRVPPVWSRLDSRAFTGTGAVEREEIDLLRGFRGLEEPRDPLAGLHADPDGGCRTREAGESESAGDGGEPDRATRPM